jgi:hypothetical protein
VKLSLTRGNWLGVSLAYFIPVVAGFFLLNTFLSPSAKADSAKSPLTLASTSKLKPMKISGLEKPLPPAVKVTAPTPSAVATSQLPAQGFKGQKLYLENQLPLLESQLNSFEAKVGATLNVIEAKKVVKASLHLQASLVSTCSFLVQEAFSASNQLDNAGATISTVSTLNALTPDAEAVQQAQTLLPQLALSLAGVKREIPNLQVQTS